MIDFREAARPLAELKPQHGLFIRIDSDGCTFDSVEVKHEDCFTPSIIKHWGLQTVSKYANEAAEFVNPYSKWLGINRWPALVMVFDLPRERPADIVYDVPPSLYVHEILEAPKDKAGMFVISATPVGAVTGEWDEHSIAQYTHVIAGKELGKKEFHIELAAKGKYPFERILMIGNAPEDMKASRTNDVLF